MPGRPSQLTVEQVTSAVSRIEVDGIGNHVNWLWNSYSIGALAVTAAGRVPSMEGFDPNAVDPDTTDFMLGVTVGSAVVRQALGKDFNLTALSDALTSAADIDQDDDAIELPDLLGGAWETCLSEMSTFSGKDSPRMIAGFSIVLRTVLSDEIDAKQKELDDFNNNLFAMLDMSDN